MPVGRSLASVPRRFFSLPENEQIVPLKRFISSSTTDWLRVCRSLLLVHHFVIGTGLLAIVLASDDQEREGSTDQISGLTAAAISKS